MSRLLVFKGTNTMKVYVHFSSKFYQTNRRLPWIKKKLLVVIGFQNYRRKTKFTKGRLYIKGQVIEDLSHIFIHFFRIDSIISHIEKYDYICF